MNFAEFRDLVNTNAPSYLRVHRHDIKLQAEDTSGRLNVGIISSTTAFRKHTNSFPISWQAASWLMKGADGWLVVGWIMVQRGEEKRSRRQIGGKSKLVHGGAAMQKQETGLQQTFQVFSLCVIVRVWMDTLTARGRVMGALLVADREDGIK